MELNFDDFPPVGDKSWRLPKNNSSQVWQYFRLHLTKDNEVFCMEEMEEGDDGEEEEEREESEDE